MATSGLDGQMKVWDVRTYKTLQEYYTPRPASSMTISHKGLLAVAFGPHLSVWKDAFKTKQKEPYMTHLVAGSTIHDIHFCPYEDVLGCGHSTGFSSLVVPGNIAYLNSCYQCIYPSFNFKTVLGSGEPNFDTFEANPYQTRKQRQESEVHSLIDKIQPDMITLDPTIIGRVDKAQQQAIEEERRLEWEVSLSNLICIPFSNCWLLLTISLGVVFSIIGQPSYREIRACASCKRKIIIHAEVSAQKFQYYRYKARGSASTVSQGSKGSHKEAT